MSLVANYQRRVVKTRLRYQNEPVAGSKLPAKSCEDTITLPERACRWAQSHAKSCEDTITLPERACRWEQSQAKSYNNTVTSTRGAFATAFAKTENLTRSTRGAFATAFANSPKTLGGRAYTKGRSPSGRSLNGKISFFFALVGSPTREVAHQTFISNILQLKGF